MTSVTKTLKGPITIETVVKIVEKALTAACEKERITPEICSNYGKLYCGWQSLDFLYHPLKKHEAEYEAKKRGLEARIRCGRSCSEYFKIDIVNKTKMEDIINGQIIPSVMNEYIFKMDILDTGWRGKKLQQHLEMVLDQAQERFDEVMPANTVRIEVA